VVAGYVIIREAHLSAAAGIRKRTNTMAENKPKIIELKEKIIDDNDADAEVLRDELRGSDTYYVNIMSSPGSGKTTTLLRTAQMLKDDFRIGILEADIDSDVDAKTMLDAGIDSVQLHTGGMCHLSADMSRQALAEIGTDDHDLVFLENVGNLVCPAEFDTGAQTKVVILSVPEGDDKPLKYPLMFTVADVVLINKIDAMEVFDFDMNRVVENIHGCKAGIPVFPVSAETGEGFEPWIEWMRNTVNEWRAK